MTALILGMVLISVGVLWPIRPRRRAAPQVRQNHRRAAEEALRQATRSSREAAEARAAAKANVHKLYDYQWGALFYADSHPSMAESMARNAPRLQARINTETIRAADLDKVVAEALQQARTAQAALAKADPPARQPADLVVLARLCWKGWLASRRNRVLY